MEPGQNLHVTSSGPRQWSCMRVCLSGHGVMFTLMIWAHGMCHEEMQGLKDTEPEGECVHVSVCACVYTGHQCCRKGLEISS